MVKFLKDNLFYLVLFNISIMFTILGYLIYAPNNNVYYVDNVKLFDGFTMTKQMKSIGEKEFNKKKKGVDSLYTLLQNPTTSNKSTTEIFIKKREELEKFNQEYAINEVEKIWARINVYSNEFSEEKGYTIVIGSDNKRNVLFASKQIDITNDLLAYMNNKYEGK